MQTMTTSSTLGTLYPKWRQKLYRPVTGMNQVFYRPHSTRERNVFTGICDSVQGEGGGYVLSRSYQEGISCPGPVQVGYPGQRSVPGGGTVGPYQITLPPPLSMLMGGCLVPRLIDCVFESESEWKNSTQEVFSVLFTVKLPKGNCFEKLMKWNEFCSWEGRADEKCEQSSKRSVLLKFDSVILYIWCWCRNRLDVWVENRNRNGIRTLRIVS